MIDPKKSIVFGLAAALMITTSVSAYAIPDDGTRPVPTTTTTPEPAVKDPAPEVIGEEVAAIEADDVEVDDDVEDEDGDEDEDDVADDDADDEDGDEDDVAEEDADADDEEETADADDADDADDEEETADADDADDGDEEDGEDFAEGDEEDEDGDEEDVAEGDEIDGPDAIEEGGIYEVVAMTDCKTRYCGKLVLSDETGKVIYSTVNNFDPAFEASLSPYEVTFAHVHVGCKMRGYFDTVEGADGEERNGFYVQEFL